MSHRQRNAENGVGAESALVRCPVQLAELLIQPLLIVCVESADGTLNFIFHVALCLQYALAAIAGFVAISEFNRFAFACRRS
jgi:hypothetical protein